MQENFHYSVVPATGKPGHEIVLVRKADNEKVVFYQASCTNPAGLLSHMNSLTEAQLSAFFPSNKQHKTNAKKEGAAAAAST